jgi:hypothetical protein
MIAYGVLFVAGSIPPIYEDVSFMIGSYGMISSRTSTCTLPILDATSATILHVASIGFTGFIDNSLSCDTSHYTDNGNAHTGSIEFVSDDDSSDSKSIQRAILDLIVTQRSLDLPRPW